MDVLLAVCPFLFVGMDVLLARWTFLIVGMDILLAGHPFFETKMDAMHARHPVWRSGRRSKSRYLIQKFLSQALVVAEKSRGFPQRKDDMTTFWANKKAAHEPYVLGGKATNRSIDAK